MTGAWSVVIRFACHIPFGMVAFNGRAIYSTLIGLDETGIFDVIPHGQAFLSGLSMYSTWGIFGFAWNFITFLGCFVCASYLCVLLGLVDTLIAVSLAVSAAKQAQFMPTTQGACGGATDWRNGTDGRNFFLTANSTTFESYGEPSALCFFIVQNWTITIAVVVLYGLTGIINIGVGMVVVYGERQRRARYQQTYGNNRHVRSRPKPGQRRSGVMGLVGWLFAYVVFILDQFLAAHRFSFRYICKALQKAKSQKHGKDGQRKEKAPSAGKRVQERRPDADEHPEKPFELPVNMLKQVHFIELVETSQRSKALRMRIFGQEDVPGSEQLDDLRQVTCQNKAKSSCEMCGIQTCPDCEMSVTLAASITFNHLTACRPNCSKCYYKRCCREWWPASGSPAGHGYNCRLGRKPDRKATALDTVQVKRLCGMCAALAPAERTEKLEAMEKLELDRLARHPLVCDGCNEMLSDKGPRWWICQHCHNECTSHIHPPWAAG